MSEITHQQPLSVGYIIHHKFHQISILAHLFPSISQAFAVDSPRGHWKNPPKKRATLEAKVLAIGVGRRNPKGEMIPMSTKAPRRWVSSAMFSWFIFGYGSIPTNTIFRGMNIHLPAILMFTRDTRFWHTAIYILQNLHTCLYIYICWYMIIYLNHFKPWFRENGVL